MEMLMEAICSSETSVDFHLTVRRYIPEDASIEVMYDGAGDVDGGDMLLRNVD
jgi:hypothetical protein